MPDRTASGTALRTAYLRAAHQVLDAPPRILEDPFAVRLLGPGALQRITGGADRYQTPGVRALRAHVVLRSRYAEDRLFHAVLRGATQYVILGAGFDTFALRQPSWAQSLRILEVDHPGTQEMKRARVASAGLVMPGNAGFADIDFGNESLRGGLLRHGAAVDEPTFFSWLGVTMYLEEDAIDAVLRSVAGFPRGSEIVLTFASLSSGHPSPLSRRTERLGEPWVSYFEPDAIEGKLRGAGFSKVEFLSPGDARGRYFLNRGDGLSIPETTNIVSAVL